MGFFYLETNSFVELKHDSSFVTFKKQKNN